MDDNSFDDDFGRKPGAPRPDYDAELTNYKRFYENTPPEKHIEAQEAAEQYLKHGIVREAVSNTRSIVLVDDPNDIRRIQEAAASDAEKAARAASTQASAKAAGTDTTGAPGGNPDPAFTAAAAEAVGAAPGSGSPSTEGGAAQPNSLESTLANIRMNGARQNRIVVSGDPLIEKKWLETLEARGQMFRQGGTPVITASRREALKVLQEVAKEFPGASATHALSMKMDREGGGILGSLAAGIKNNMTMGWRRHQMDVIVVGTPEVQAEKMKELGGFVEAMQQKGHVGAKEATVVEGKLVVGEKGPVELNTSRQMLDVLAMAKDKVNAYDAQQSAVRDEVKAHKHEKDVASMKEDRAKAPEKDAGAGDATGKDAVVKPSPNTLRLVEDLDKAIKSPGLLTTKNEHNTEEGVLLLRAARKRKDPDTPEIAALPDGMREKAVVQFAALLQKADDKTFGPAFKKELDNAPTAGEQSIREKVDVFINAEAKRDPSFGDKAAPLLKDMVERHVLTEKQAEAVSGRIADAVTAAHGAAAKEAPAADASKAAEAGKDSTTASASADAAKASTAAPAGAEARPAADAKDAAAPAAESKSLATDSSSVLAANSAAPAGVSKDGRIEPTLGNPTDAGAAPAAAAKAPAEAPAPAAEKPQGVRDRIEALVKEGPANLTAEKAHALVAELDGLRSKPLAALDSGSGANPTRTLVRTEALLKELESGRFGPELKAQAKDLAEPLQKWEKQDISRFNNDASVKTVSRDDVVAGVKTGMSKWGGAEPSAQADAVAPAPAPKNGPAGEAQSIPANPDKAPASTHEAAAPVATPAAKAEASAPAAQEQAQAKGEASAPAKAEATAPAKADAQATATADATAAPKADAPAAKVDAAAEVKAAPVQDPAVVAAKEQAALRLTETESAGGKLSQLMANPAGSFTNRDKTWNEDNIQRAAKEVMRLDPESMSQLSPQQRAKVVVYATWVAENARDGKLPGFSSEEGKASAQQLVDRAASLIGKLEPGAKTTPDVDKSVEKADRLVTNMAQLQKEASASNQATREEAPRGSIGPGAANALAKDLVSAVYQSKEPREADTKYLLKNAAHLTPATTKEMDPQSRAQTAVAMSHLAQKVRDGALGDFSKLPSSVQKQTIATANAAETMLTSMGKDPSMRAELNQAYSELHAKTGKQAAAPAPKVDGMDHAAGGAKSTPTNASSDASAGSKVDATSASKTPAQAAPAASKPEGRSLDR